MTDDNVMKYYLKWTKLNLGGQTFMINTTLLFVLKLICI